MYKYIMQNVIFIVAEVDVSHLREYKYGYINE